MHMLSRFELNNQVVFYEEVRAKTTIQLMPLVNHRNRYFYSIV